MYSRVQKKDSRLKNRRPHQALKNDFKIKRDLSPCIINHLCSALSAWAKHLIGMVFSPNAAILSYLPIKKQTRVEWFNLHSG